MEKLWCYRKTQRQRYLKLEREHLLGMNAREPEGDSTKTKHNKNHKYLKKQNPGKIQRSSNLH